MGTYGEIEFKSNDTAHDNEPRMNMLFDLFYLPLEQTKTMTDLEQKIETIKTIFQGVGKSQAEIETIENHIKNKPELSELFDDLPLRCPADALEVRFQKIMIG